jgi:hypothetical protein
MASLPPFDAPGDWFKGNLHTHTTQSDGRATPAENMHWHADHGYHFVALTDHNRVTSATQFAPQPPLLTIPGAEINARRGDVEYHIVALGIQDMPIAHNSDAQSTIDAVNAAGGLCFIAHPYWCDLVPDDLLALHGHIGLEIFNTGCRLEINKGHALVHWDAVLRRGQRALGLAVDDSHWKYPDHGGGWVMARAPRLDAPSIVAAIRQGQFYSTQGPEIYDVQIEDRQVTVRCSPARSIYVIGDAYHCPNAAQAWDNAPLTQATFTLRAQQQYLRVEVVDMQCRSAWTNAYFV